MANAFMNTNFASTLTCRTKKDECPALLFYSLLCGFCCSTIVVVDIGVAFFVGNGDGGSGVIPEIIFGVVLFGRFCCFITVVDV